MIEQQWLASNDPVAMMGWLLDESQAGASDRRLLLFSCARVRRVWHLLVDDRSRRAVEVAERFADGEATVDDMKAVVEDAWAAARTAAQEYTRDAFGWAAAVAAERADAWRSVAADARHVVSDSASAAETDDERLAEMAELAALLRDAFGNPFRICALRPEWLTTDALAVAAAAYDDRMPDGRLDPARLAVLSDALEDAGCDDAALLSALRADAPRYRGFWALDAVMGMCERNSA